MKKRVTLTYVMEWDSDEHIGMTDQDLIESAIEVQSQDRNWPNDQHIKVEEIPE